MKTAKFGKLPPRYKFILNQYEHLRVSKCPICRRLTHMRKFALLVYIDEWGFLALGKTCRYCSLCELIVAHQDELEHELAGTFERVAPDVIGNQYMVLGTVDKKWWKEGLNSVRDLSGDALEHLADFKKVLGLDPGGWRPPGYQ
jgi:hypothetical protein